ncbi:hypothetical protein Vadar_030152 [Vaccinium darrowii]|uniref:Uncharacterized protein n=1 Tax=Vaccinium darrowii TaxID=229202 RepID=A0ACB7XU94_9ERIC|nr:hypothetical protein Vadar_030152 [Vaccinium darrowii]
MQWRAGCLSIFAKTPILFVYSTTRLNLSLFHHWYHSPTPLNATIRSINNRFSVTKQNHLLTTTVVALVREPSSNKKLKKARYDSPEGKLRGKLDSCSKDGDLAEALWLYDVS